MMHLRLLALLAASVLLGVSARGEATATTPKLPHVSYAPRPDYPHIASISGWQGTGLFLMRVEIKSGRVKAVYIDRSTGHKDLDAAAIAALKQWRFEPNVMQPMTKNVPHRKISYSPEDSLAMAPITFVLR